LQGLTAQAAPESSLGTLWCFFGCCGNWIRPLAMGRKNWTFAGSDEGGHRAAAIYTLSRRQAQ